MKKIFMATAVIATLALSAIGASASMTDATESFTPTNGSYTVTVSGLTAGNMYGMVAINGSTISESNIQYIDQQTANANGEITFKDFAPMTAVAAGSSYNVYIGGADTAFNGTAKQVGVLTAAAAAPAPTTYAISGTVTDSVDAREAKVTVYASTDTEYATPIASADTVSGAYSIDVAPGTYSVVITKAGRCSYTLTGVTVSDATVAIGATNISGLVGDVDGNNEVKLSDLNLLLSDYDKTGTNIATANSDLDGNGEVKLSDLNSLLGSYDETAVVVPFNAGE